jgi:hypothetical protein
MYCLTIEKKELNNITGKRVTKRYYKLLPIEYSDIVKKIYIIHDS